MGRKDQRLRELSRKITSSLTDAERAEFDRLSARARRATGRDTSNLDSYRGVNVDYGKDKDYDRAFDRYIRHGIISPKLVERHEVVSANEYRVSGGLTTSPNDSQTDTGLAGYAIPQAFWKNLQIALKAFGGLSSQFKQLSTPTGAPMPWPVIDPTGVVAGVLGQEITSMAVANPYVFGQGMMQAYTVAVNPVLASLQLIQDNAFNVNDFLSRLLGEAIGRELAALAVSGTGSAQPLGLVTALNSRGATGTVGGAIAATGGFVNLVAAQAVKTFATSNPTELGGNLLAPTTLLAMLQSVDPAYYPTSAWYFNATQAWNLRSVVDSNGRPIINFVNGFDADDPAAGTPASVSTVNSPVAKLFGFPVVIDNAIPNLTASTTGGPCFGSAQHAMVMRTVANGAHIMRLAERYADFLAVGFLAWGRYEIRSNDLRAAVTVKPAAT